MRTTLLIAAAAAALAAAPAYAQPGGPDAREFLTKAIQGDTSEIQLGMLAKRKGASEETRRFGAMLAHDHGMARTQAERVARAYGARPARGMTPEATSEQQKLSALQGPAFDQEFASYMVQDHQKDIQDFTQEAQSAHGRVAAFARRSLPVLQKHLDMASRLQGSGR